MDYQKIYDEFMAKYSKTETTPSEAGEVLAKIAAIYGNYNMDSIKAEHTFSIIHKTIAESNDENGKPMSSSKALVLAEATKESIDFRIAKGHVTNIEMLIGCLKFLQKALETEYLNSSN